MERETHLAMLRARATHVPSPPVAKDGSAQLDALRANGLAHRLAAPEPEPEPEPRGFAKRECVPLSPGLRAECEAAADRLSQRVAGGEHHRRRAAAAVTAEMEAARRARAAQLPEEWRRAEATCAREGANLAERRAAESASMERRRQHTAERLAHDRKIRQEAASRQMTAQEQINANQLAARAHRFNAAAAHADAAAARLRARIARQAEARNTSTARPARSGPPPQRSELAALEAGEREDLIYTLTREELMQLMGEEHGDTDTGSEADSVGAGSAA